MNSVVRFGCRVCQFCFRLSIPILPYRDPEISRSVNDVPGKLYEPLLRPFLR